MYVKKKTSFNLRWWCGHTLDKTDSVSEKRNMSLQDLHKDLHTLVESIPASVHAVSKALQVKWKVES